MKKALSLILFFIGLNSIYAQVNWSNDIADIIYDKCVECHRPNGIGPYSFMNYENAYDFRYLIQGAISSGEMPPWLPDKDYRHFADEFF
ncbi:MAG: mono/diheme cytochrome c family protein [Maribacter sp.]|jgi:mono/diheme cytochrome c family protein